MIWQGVDREGVQIIIDQDAWTRHVLKHPEIAPFLNEVAYTMGNPERIFPDIRPDEPNRYFRRLYCKGLLSDYFFEHYVRVAVKYVRQANGEFIGFYSSSWFQRTIVEPHSELEKIHHVD